MIVDTTLSKQAIGRDGYIGQLYDLRTESLGGFGLFQSALPDNLSRIVDSPEVKYTYSVEDSFKSKFSNLNVDASLGLSVLSGLVSLQGSGSYLAKINNSSKKVKASFVYNVRTKHESIDFSHNSIKKFINFPTLKSTTMTHVVVGITWGANILCSFEHNVKDDDDEKVIKGQLDLCLKKMAFSLSGKATGTFEETEKHFMDKFTMSFFGDVLPDNGQLPQSVDSVLEMMKNAPQLISKVNDGKGKPLEFILLPLSALSKILSVQLDVDTMLKSISSATLARIEEQFKAIFRLMGKIDDLYDEVIRYSSCIEEKLVDDFINSVKALQVKVQGYRGQVKQFLVEVRSGQKDEDKDGGLFTNLPEEIEVFIIKQYQIQQKINFIRSITARGINYVGSTFNLTNLGIKPLQECIILCYNDALKRSNADIWNKNWELFCSLRQNESQKGGDTIFCLLDHKITKDWRPCHCIYVQKYRGDILLTTDLYKEQGEVILNSSIITMLNTRYSAIARNPTYKVEIVCPFASKYQCSKGKRQWICSLCLEYVKYDFCGTFYCSCGATKIDECLFKCCERRHTRSEKVDSVYLNNLLAEMRYNDDINVLVLGETGVGKSTFINAFANYLNADSLDEAEKEDINVIIPCDFTVTGRDYKPKKVTVGENDGNETFISGKSSTKGPRAYVFPCGERRIRIIDTPGIGDVDGSEVDEKNFEKILAYISRHKRINGILILLKPNNARLNVYFRFCINELLTHLHKEAMKNILFCFTNARGTFYMPGDTLPVLETYLQDLEKRTKISYLLNEDTMYCFDNEAFRFLAALKNGITFTPQEKNAFSSSWTTSVNESKRLFKRILELDPHNTEDTLSINKARKLISDLARPLAELSRNIETNIQVLLEKQEEIDKDDLSIEELRVKLMVPSLVLKAKVLDYPRTVCTNCVATLNEGGVSKIHYKTHCHEHCYLGDVPLDIKGHSELRGCSAMNASGNCNVCGCHWQAHMHIDYETYESKIEIEDDGVKFDLGRTKERIKSLVAFKTRLNKRINDLKEEQKIIMETLAKFASFIKMNSIMPYNDAIGEYLKHLIKEEKRYPEDRSAKIQNLETLLASFQEEVKAFDQFAQKGDGQFTALKDIPGLIEKLYKLPIKGEELRDIMTKVENSHVNSLHYTEKICIPENNTKGGLGSRSWNYFKGLLSG